MTRENKLALVVGFALILFVGILISDHLSSSQTLESANLSDGIRDPLAHAQADRPGLIVLSNTGQVAPGNAADTASAAPSERDSAGDDANAIYMGNTRPRPEAGPEIIGLDETMTGALPFTYHQVRRGETLASICRAQFGDPSLASELAAYNGIDNPNSVNAGRRLRLPKKADVLIRGGQPLTVPVASQPTPTPAATKPQPEQQPAAPTYATYTIKKGDVLSKLAQDLLGTTRRMNELLELNRDVIKNPDRLIPGTEIRVPNE